MLHLRFLGTYHVTFADGRAPAIDTAKSKALLAYLATENDRPHLREKLAALFWPEADQKAAMQSLRQALYTLRRQLQPASTPDQATASPHLTVTRQDVAFNFDSEYWCDVEQFTALIRAMQQHPHPQIETCPECVAGLEDAVELYRGDFLTGLTLPDADEFEAWRLARQEWYRAQMLRALLSLVSFYERRRNFGVAQRFMLRYLELEPWDEDAHRRLMRLYALDNQRTAALQQFEAVRHMLAQQFDASPAPETLQLLQETQSGKLYMANMLVWGLTYDTVEHPADPQGGGQVYLLGELAPKIISHQVQFVQSIFEARRYQNLGLKDVVLAGRVKCGIIPPIQDTDQIPIYRRFFSGGPTSMRAYRIYYLGPRDLAGNPLGGESIVLANMEVRFPIYKDFRGVTFFDAGNVFYKMKNTDLGQLKYGAGFGLRYQTPIGPIGLELAWPLNPIQSSRDTLQVIFNIGQSF